MSQLIDWLAKTWEGKIDPAGQRDVERFSQIGLVASAVVAFVVGGVAQDIRLLLAVYAVGTLATLLVTCPPWRAFNAHPIKWRADVVDPKIAALVK